MFVCPLGEDAAKTYWRKRYPNNTLVEMCNATEDYMESFWDMCEKMAADSVA